MNNVIASAECSSGVLFFFTIAFLMSTMKPKQWRVHNLLSKLPCHFLYSYAYFFH
jgi:hypothetical protein